MNGLDGSIFQMIVFASMETIGVIEVLKNFFSPARKKVWTVIMIPLSMVFCLIYNCLPVWVSAGILTIGTCQICYDVILQNFKNLSKKLGG